MWTSNKKQYLFFLLIVLFIGVVGGVFFLQYMGESSKEIVLSNINEWVMKIEGVHVNYILSHMLILSMFLVIASFFIGMPLYIFYLFYNGFSIGFIVSSLGAIFGFKGIVYSFLYILVTKGIYLFFLLFFLFFLIRIGEKVFLRVIRREKGNGDIVHFLYKKSLLVFAIIFVNDVFLYFLGGKILNIFSFLLG